MNFVLFVLVLTLSFVGVVTLVAMLFAVVRRGKGISKDYAESIALRKHGQGQVVGARFTRIGRKWIWEFDVRDGMSIRRIWVDARAASIVKMVELSPSERYTSGSGRLLGKRID